jgi:NADPH:quinone reductase-like Zn-dependent oxidoreductase
MEKKSWYQSKTIWGIVIAALGFVATQYFQVPIDVPANPDFEQLKAHTEAIKAAQGNVGIIAGQIAAAIGSIVAIIGRIKADTPLS